MDLVLGSAHTGDWFRRQLLDHRDQELPLQDSRRQGGSCPNGGGRQFLVADTWSDRGPRGSLLSSSLVVLPPHLF